MQFDELRRREFITLLGGAAVMWPGAARAQLAMPAIGFLDSRLPDAITDRLRGFREGLKDTGYVEGENLAIVYRLAENQDDRLPELAADLVRRRVAVIAAGGTPSTFAAQAATKTIPVVFLVGDDPVRLSLVTSLSRPGGNMTGINLLNAEVTGKRLELLREFVPGLVRIAVLVNPADQQTETQLKGVNAAAGAMGLQIQVFNANTSAEDRRALPARTRRTKRLAGRSAPSMKSREAEFRVKSGARSRLEGHRNPRSCWDDPFDCTPAATTPPSTGADAHRPRAISDPDR
jgi:ABC-type uncharacterized transport system substrate-binding protein